jgi:hypothetical protein
MFMFTRIDPLHQYVQGDCYVFADRRLAWGIRNAYKHGTPVVDVLESASAEWRGADGIDARA